MAVGQQAKALGVTSVAVGNLSRALENNAVAMGNYANAGAGGAIAIGLQANYQPKVDAKDGNAEIPAAFKQTGANSVTIGVRANASMNHAIAMGTESKALAQGAVAVGSESKTEGTNATAIGQASEAKGQNSFAGGNDSHAIGKSAVAIGDGAGKGTKNLKDGSGDYASGESSTAVGPYTKSAGAGSTAVGYAANAKNERTVAVGAESSVLANQGIAIGDKAKVEEKGLEAIPASKGAYTTKEIDSKNAIAIGKESIARGVGSIALGSHSETRFMNATAVGNETKALGYNSTAMGFQALAKGVSSIAIGDKALAGQQGDDHIPIANRGIAIGVNSNATGETAVTVGSNADVKVSRGTALGVLSQVTQREGVALGAYSVANRAAGQTGADPLSARDATTDQSVWVATHAAVSVGNDVVHKGQRQGNSTKVAEWDIPVVTRQITNVAAGTQNTDAVNVAQLKAAGFVLDTAATSEGELGTKTVDATKKEADDKVQNGETVTIEADKNIKVTQTAAKVTIATKDDVKFTSVTTGDTVMNNDGITIKAPANQQGLNPTTDVKLTTNGLDNGGNKVVNVADGNVAADSKDAVNGSQLHAVKTTAEGKLGSFTVGADKAATAAGIVVNKDNARFDIVGADSGKVTTAVEGNKVTVDLTQEAKDSLAKADSALQNVVSNDPNLTATKNGDTITLGFSDTPTFKGVTAGEGENQVVLDNKGVNVGGNTYISNAGLNANNKAVMNVASNLPVTNDNTATAGQPNNRTTAQTKPANVDAIKNNAATVADVLNAGFNLQTNGTATDFVKPYDTVNFADGTGTTVTSETDGNKTTFKVNVDAQKLAETAQLPVVYTKADGTKVYKHADGNFYTDPTDKTNKVEPTEIIASMQGADGSTANPTTLAKVQAGKKDTDAVNVSQLKGVVDALGGGAGFNLDGSVKAPSYSLTDPTSGTVSTVNNVGDALTHLNTSVNKPFVFVGDVGTFDRKLGQTTTVKGGVISEAELSNSNIGVVAKDGTLEIKLAKDVNVDSVVAGGTKIDSNGLTFINANGLPVDNSPSISKTGINAGNQKITNVAKGTDDTDAVNVAQLKEVDTKAGVKTKVTAGEGVDVTNKGTADAPNYEVALNQQTKDSLNKADSAVQSIVIKAEGSQVKELTKDNNELNIKGDTNIRVTNDNGEVKVALNKDVTGLDSLTSKKVTAGEGPNQVVLDNKGVNVGGKTYISDAGLNANDKKITNVADGAVTVDSKDAVNGSQLRNTAGDIANIIGGNAVVDDQGNVTASNIGDTGVANINDAIKTVKTTVKSSDNTIKVTTNTANPNEGTVFDISVDAQKLAESAQLPVVYTDKEGNKVYKVNGKFTKDPTGVDAAQVVPNADVIASMQSAGGSITDPTTLANVDKGKNDNDAVNVSQLKGAVDVLGGGAAVNSDGTIKAPTYNITNPADGKTNTASNVGDALGHLNNAVNSPLTFGGDTGTDVTRKLGQKVSVVGGVTDKTKLSSGNIGVVANGNDQLEVKLAKDLTGLSSAQFQDAAAGNTTTVNSNGVTITPANQADPTKVVSLTKDGLNNGGNVISNVANGAETFAAPQVNGEKIKLANDGKWYKESDVGANGKPTDTATAIDPAEAFKKTPNGGLVNFEKSNLNNAATVGDLQNLGFVIGTADDKYKDQVRNNSRVEFASGNKNATVTGSTLADGTRQVKVTISDNPVFNTIQVGGDKGPKVGSTSTGDLSVSKADGSAARITNVAPGVNGTDAVNVNQLNQGLGDVHKRINKTNKDLRGGIAGSNAAAGLPQVYLPGKSMVAAAAGTYKGESAVAVGYSRASDNGKVILKLQGNANTRGDFGGSVGVGYQW